jgi:sialic acid synthase SpsE
MVMAGMGLGRKNGCRIIAALDGHIGDDPDLARRLMDEAREAGADGVKLVWRTSESQAAGEVARYGSSEGTVRATLQQPQLPLDALVWLVESAGPDRVVVAPYDVCAARQLASTGLFAWKLDPPMLSHLPLIDELAADGRPIIAGIAGCTRRELEETVSRLPRHAVLVHTLPSGPLLVDVLDIAHLVALRRYGFPVGYADGSLDPSAALMAVALGATLVEKPLTLSRLDAPADATGLYFYAFRAFVDQVRRLEGVLEGVGAREPLPGEQDLIDQDRVSIVASRSIPRGTVLTRDMLALKAPGSGLSPRFIEMIEGRATLYDIPQGTFLTFGVIDL